MADVWYTWSNNCTTSSCTTGSSTTWAYWCSNDTTTSATSDTVWVNWNATTTSSYVASGGYAPVEVSQQLAEEQRLRVEAEKRAEELLLSVLSLEQALQYERERHFVVEGRRHRYRIRRGRSGNVDVIDAKGIITHRLCIHPQEFVPDQDTMLAQKLHLEDDEESFLRLANRHPNYGSNAPVLPALH